MKFVEIVSKNQFDTIKAYCGYDEDLYQAHKMAALMADKYKVKMSNFRYVIHESSGEFWGFCVEHNPRDITQKKVSIFDSYLLDLEISGNALKCVSDSWRGESSHIEYDDFLDIDIKEYEKAISGMHPEINEDVF